jgi:hypothetical protein
MEHDVKVQQTIGGDSNWSAVCSCGWSTGAPDELGVAQEEIWKRVRDHKSGRAVGKPNPPAVGSSWAVALLWSGRLRSHGR